MSVPKESSIGHGKDDGSGRSSSLGLISRSSSSNNSSSNSSSSDGSSSSSSSDGSSSSSSSSSSNGSIVPPPCAYTVADLSDPFCAFLIHKRVMSVVNHWGPLKAINPETFLNKLLENRGYDTSTISAPPFRPPPSSKQMQDYNTDFIHVIRHSDLRRLQTFHEKGTSMTACNAYSESILHMACRRANMDVVDFILHNGGDLGVVDDFGRTPLHDACWRMQPRFDIITLILDKNLDLLRTRDIRGSTPLSYVRQDNWLEWCAYLFYQKEKYWNR